MVTYGKSMYGGWYANFFIDGHYDGVHAESKKGLKVLLNDILGKKNWEFSSRYDN